VSAAAAVSWELRFLGRHEGRQRCCQENAGGCVSPPDETGSQGTSADVEVAVVGNSGRVCGDRRRGASVRRNETGNRDRRPASRSLPTLSSWERLESAGAQSGDVAVAVAVTERGRPLGVRAVRRTGSTETSVRPVSASVETATSGKEPAGRPTARTIRGVRPPPCCVDFVCHCSVFVLFCH